MRGEMREWGPKILVQRLLPSAQMPRYAHSGAYGDLAADLFACGGGYVGSSRGAGFDGDGPDGARDGVAFDAWRAGGRSIGACGAGITTLAGVIDPGYRGELKIVLTNLTRETQMVAPGHRIAQLRIVERIQARFEETDMLAETERGEGGFGSTGR